MSNATRLAVLYDRASTSHQRDNWSRDDAARFLDKVVADHGYQGEVRQEIKSGESLVNRPVMKQLLEEIAQGKVAAVVTQDFTRLSRDEDGIDGRIIRQTCRDAGTLVITPQKTYDFDDDGDDLLADIHFFVGKVHKRQSLLAMTRGQKEKARQGKLDPTYATFGFDWSERYADDDETPGVKAGAKKPGAKLQVVPEEADVVRRIFDMYETMSQWKVALTLNREGALKPIKSRSWRKQTQTKQEGRRVVVQRPELRTERYWHPTDINKVITNPIYVGLVEWGKTTRSRFMKDFEGVSHHRPELQIVSLEQFNRCGKIMKERWKHPGVSSEGKYVFSGLIRCRHCGGRMTGKRHRENRGGREIVAKIYWCRAYHMLGKIGCQGQTIYETFVKKVMVPVVIDLLQNHIRLDDALREAAEEMASPSLGTKREQYNAELAQIALAQERLVDAVAQGLFQPEEVRRKQMELREKKEYAEKRLANLDRNQEASTEIAEALRLVEGDLSDLLENAPDIQLQRLCQLVFRSFSIEGEGIAKQRKGKLVAYEFTPEFQELLAASTPNTHAPALLIEWCGARKGR